MPKGIRNGSNELAIAYARGRIDDRIETTFERQIEIWSERFSLHPMELRERLENISPHEGEDHVLGRGMRSSASTGLGKHLAAPQMVGEASSHESQGHRSGLRNSSDAPHQVRLLPAPEGKRGIVGWFNKDGSPMTPEQRKKESRRRMLKRNDPLAKKMLQGSVTNKGKSSPPKTQTPQESLKEQIARMKKRQSKGPLTPADQKRLATLQVKLVEIGKPDRKAADRERKRKWWQEHKGKKAPAQNPPKKKTSQHQPLYVQRSLLRKQGVPEDQLPPLPSKNVPQQQSVA